MVSRDLRGGADTRARERARLGDGELGRPVPGYLCTQSNYSDLISVARRG